MASALAMGVGATVHLAWFARLAAAELAWEGRADSVLR